MKKAVAGILTAAMTMSLLAGCGSGDSNSGTKDTQAPAGTTGESTAAGDTAGAPESDGGSAVAEGQKDYIDYDEDPYEVVIEGFDTGIKHGKPSWRWKKPLMRSPYRQLIVRLSFRPFILQIMQQRQLYGQWRRKGRYLLCRYNRSVYSVCVRWYDHSNHRAFR